MQDKNSSSNKISFFLCITLFQEVIRFVRWDCRKRYSFLLLTDLAREIRWSFSQLLLGTNHTLDNRNVLERKVEQALYFQLGCQGHSICTYFKIITKIRPVLSLHISSHFSSEVRSGSHRYTRRRSMRYPEYLSNPMVVLARKKFAATTMHG